jgi:hypothetical protein
MLSYGARSYLTTFAEPCAEPRPRFLQTTQHGRDHELQSRCCWPDDPARCNAVVEIVTLLTLYATIQALAVTTTTKAASNQPIGSISATCSGLFVSCKFAIDTPVA